MPTPNFNRCAIICIFDKSIVLDVYDDKRTLNEWTCKNSRRRSLSSVAWLEYTQELIYIVVKIVLVKWRDPFKA